MMLYVKLIYKITVYYSIVNLNVLDVILEYIKQMNGENNF